jgi:deazaflavin-dependent oxidoreductase (nitroreductase family)
MSKVLMPLDMRFKGTRFAPSRLAPGTPLCFLTTTGRSSGELRTVPLLYVPVSDGDIAVVATNFGTRNHPGWALNLEAEPTAEVEIDGERRSVVSRKASDGEAERIWQRFDAVWPGYEKYREIAPRDIKVFVLEDTAGRVGSTDD